MVSILVMWLRTKTDTLWNRRIPIRLCFLYSEVLDSQSDINLFIQFITTVVTSWLDGKHVRYSMPVCLTYLPTSSQVVFGEVLEGMDIVYKIGSSIDIRDSAEVDFDRRGCSQGTK
jgi:hypothetical protein